MLKSFFLGACLIAMVGCSYREEKNKRTASGSIGFAEIKAAILTPSCLGCHSSGQLVNLVTYEQVKANLGKIQDVVMVRKTMPKRGPLEEADLAMLAKWIADGAPEIGPPPAGVPGNPGGERAVVKYPELKQKVLNGRCFVCHYPNNPEFVSNLDSYDEFKGTISTSYFLSVIRPVMPPAPKGTPEGVPNPNELTKEEKELLSYWLIDGMQP